MSFKSRKAAKDYIRENILDGYPLREPIPAGTNHQLLSEILELHENAIDKIGTGIDHFYVEETWRLPGMQAVARDLRGIVVVRTDGTSIDWSYYHVIDHPTKAAQVKTALAFPLVDPRLRRRDAAFATGEVVVCALTGDIIVQKHQADTRHLDPTWEELTSGFVAQHGGWDAIETHSGHGGIFVGRDVEDDALREEWLAYYEEHANPVFVKNDRLEEPFI
ncbi:hypothetical protein C5C52_07935 [Rathayibacter sp. AY1E5]|uniref:DCL family protein n=1 Tax=Rathayibacter sp. AY1E5 TaxID=2080553 RepID=UPI000CE91715|nr:DCL family protein [Rathayibacter sp. AY1E5]PPG81740.1 hypothetical protein C5C52_07935 [Rathayibacter sp. AY1E5]